LALKKKDKGKVRRIFKNYYLEYLLRNKGGGEVLK